jgi:uncharacterized 2Fe-2S/4Fe-4S cluster protein (DUF4445 family)
MSNNFRITFQPMGLFAEVVPDTTIRDAIGNMNIPIRFDCGGTGLCGKCRIIVETTDSMSPLTEEELDILSPQELGSLYRLACQARIQGNVTVTIPAQIADSREVRGKTCLGGSYPTDPLVERFILPKDRLTVADQSHAVDLSSWFAQRIKAATKREIYFKDLEALRQLSMPEAYESEMTLVNHAHKGITAVMSGSRQKSLGLAVDMGTTTLAAYLCDFHSGKVLSTAASVNPQRRFGEDVISRIAMADAKADGLQILNDLIISGINHLITRCVEQIGASTYDIDEVTLAGNTTMERFFARFHPHGLGISPYLPVFRDSNDLKAVEVGLILNPGTNLYLFPVISGFVGGDTVGAILADGPNHRDETCLIVDIGTNGEIVLGNRNGLWATSCATGPALEGAEISCGMRAVSGAINKVDIDPSTYRPTWTVLGNSTTILPLGICGSGIIDAIAAMRRAGILLPSGRLKEGMPGVISDKQGIGREFILVPAEKSGTGNNISITLMDVRQFQLAKSALAVGIELLMNHANITRVDRTVLTGAFGARFNWKNALDIGMLPREALSGKVLSLDNLAGVGAIMALLDQKKREEAARIPKTTRVIELAMDPNFAVRFRECTIFPPLHE